MKTFLLLILFCVSALAGDGPSAIQGSGLSATGNGSGLTGLTASQVGYTSTAVGASATTVNASTQTIPVNAVTDFGCDPTNTTECGAKLQLWLNAAFLSHNGYLPTGTYKCAQTLIVPLSTEPASFYTTIQGAGKLRSIINYTSDVIALNCNADVDNVRVLDITFSIAVSSTHAGIHLDGSLQEGGGAGGSSCDNWTFRISIQGFAQGFALNNVSNSIFDNCEPTNVGDGFVCTGFCNSNVWIDCPVGPTGIGWHMSGGRDDTVIGGDINPSGASAKAIVCDGMIGLSFTGQNIESSSTGTTNYPVVVSSGSVEFRRMVVGNFSGSSIPKYGMNVTGGSVLLSGTGVTSFANAGAQIRIDGGIVTTTDTTAIIAADDYAGGTLQDTINLGIIPTLSANDGLTASAANKGLIRWRTSQGSGDDVLQAFYEQNTGTYSIGNLLQYLTDKPVGLFSPIIGPGTAGNTGIGSLQVKADVNTYTAQYLDHTGTFQIRQFLDSTGFHTYQQAGTTVPILFGANDDLKINQNGTIVTTQSVSTGGVIIPHSYTVSTLPAAPGTGAEAIVTDSLTALSVLGVGATLTGGGSNVVPVFYNGSAWKSY